MCGICGYLSLDGAPVDPAALKKMAASIAHRGPDDEGCVATGPVGLGFRRLSIIDLSSGRQPMSDVEKTVWVAFNGEIYNFMELRGELERLGYAFRTNSDTEVIVHGYKEWGADVLKKLNGMFGLAVWDEKERSLMLARDRMGIKPLYYTLDKNTLVFGSEVRAILAQLGNTPEPDIDAMYLFLRFRYTPSPMTLFKGIKKLSPGTRLIIRDGTAAVERWWDFSPKPFDPMPDEEEAEKALIDLYRRAVKRHLIADVPVGLLLSGGLDSGLLLALMKERGGDWKTYTVGFGSYFCSDELRQASYTAGYFGSPNRPVELSRETFEETLLNIVTVLEEPVTASSVVPMYHLCARASEDVKVALMGQGPDELFGGYSRHLGVYYGRYWRALPEWLREVCGAGLKKLPRNESVKRAVSSLGKANRLERYCSVLSLASEESLRGLFREDVLSGEADAKVLECWEDLASLMAHTDELGGIQFIEVRSTLPDELLMYADKLSMAHGLEVRVPYLDVEVVEFVERLSSNYKIRSKGKWLHRRVAESILPNEITCRRKLGFETPVGGWLKSFDGKAAAIFADRRSSIYDYLKPDAVWAIANRHKSGRDDNSKLLFSLLVLEMWLKAYQR